MVNINTRVYWESRFGSGDWQNRGGFSQTRKFTLSQILHFDIPYDFAGTICDFGCGAGDSFPVYRKSYPNAKLIGTDFSRAAIDLCQDRYGNLATFFCGDDSNVPESDIIIASNVFEHLDNQLEIAKTLLAKCRELYIIVPFREMLVEGNEHVNSYETNSFDDIGFVTSRIFYSRGWSYHGMSAIYQIHFKNILRNVLGRAKLKREKQIMFLIRRNDSYIPTTQSLNSRLSTPSDKLL